MLLCSEEISEMGGIPPGRVYAVYFVGGTISPVEVLTTYGRVSLMKSLLHLELALVPYLFILQCHLESLETQFRSHISRFLFCFPCWRSSYITQQGTSSWVQVLSLWHRSSNLPAHGRVCQAEITPW